ncbi:MAG: hypothetical protein MUO26_05680 [Methanotrichaceae archaeon]|nr:hypothetical protein [Methanotrichaceae archaeon]
MAQDDNLQTNNLDIYILKNLRFKSFIFDRKEIRCIANNLGLAPDCVRTELKKLGYNLIANSHGRMVWKRDQLRHTFLANTGI